MDVFMHDTYWIVDKTIKRPNCWLSKKSLTFWSEFLNFLLPPKPSFCITVLTLKSVGFFVVCWPLQSVWSTYDRTVIFPSSDLFQHLKRCFHRPIAETRDRPTRGSEQSGCWKLPRVGWDFSDFWSFTWVFFTSETHSTPTRSVGFSANSLEKWDFLPKTTFFLDFTCYFTHSD